QRPNRFGSLREFDSKPNSKTIRAQMITIGVMVTIKYYWSVNCSAMAREWDLILPHSRQTHLARSSFGTNRRHDRDTQTYFRDQAVVAGGMVQTIHSRGDQQTQHDSLMVDKADD